MDHAVPLTAVLDIFTLPANADDHPALSNPMTTPNAISEMTESSRSLTTRICELLRAAHISKQVNPMIATLRKGRYQLWMYIEKLGREILISQEEATPKPSEGI
jgi:hypothetical protein